MVYEWLCGVRPFQGTQWEILDQHRSSQPPSLREKLPDLPPMIEEVILKALAKDPVERFVDVKAFAQALQVASCEHAPPSLSLPDIASDIPASHTPEMPHSQMKVAVIEPPQTILSRPTVESPGTVSIVMPTDANLLSVRGENLMQVGVMRRRPH